MSLLSVFRLIGVSLPFVAVAILFFLLDKKVKKFKNLKFILKQIFIGVAFAGCSILAICLGPNYNDVVFVGRSLLFSNYTINDGIAGPLIAGLLFGWPSGIIAGFISGLTRCFLFQFGTGDLLRAPESVCLFLAGILTAILRTTLFENKKPKWFYGLLIGLLVTVLQMLSNFISISFQNSVSLASGVVEQADIPTAISVSLTLCITIFIVALLCRESVKFEAKSKKISIKVQRWMALSFVLCLAFSIGFTYLAFSSKEERDTFVVMQNSMLDMELSIKNLNIDDVGTPNKENSIYKTVEYARVGENGFYVIVHEEIDADNNVKDVIYGFSSDIDKGYFGLDFSFHSKRKLSDYKQVQGEPQGAESTNKYNELNIFNEALTDTADGYEKSFICVWKSVENLKLKENGVSNPNLKVLVLYPADEAHVNLAVSLRVTSYLEVLIFVAIFGVIYIFIRNAVIRNVISINESLSAIKAGNLDIRVNVRENEEFSSLSDDINHTIDVLKKYIEEANKRINDELNFAKEIQYGSLPTVFPVNERYDLYAMMITAKSVGGDFYDFFMVDKDHLMIAIADVSGKGIPAAMFMMRAKTLVKSLVSNQDINLNEVIYAVNNDLCMNNPAQMFVTGWFGILNLNTGELQFTNAGHNPPLIRQNGHFNYLKMPAGLVLAGMENIPYKLQTLKLEPGDEIFLYTDGVTEATSTDKRLYSDQRLLNLINESEYKSSKQLLEIIKFDVDNFQAGAEQADDITMLAVRFKPKPTFPRSSILIKPKLEQITRVIDFVNKALDKCNINSNIKRLIDIGIDEILSNIVSRTSKNPDGAIVISFELVSDIATITFEDNGEQSDIVDSINEAVPGIELNEQNIPTLGLLLVKKSMHHVKYEYRDNKNILIIKRHIR